MLHCVISNKTLTTFIVKLTKKARLHPVKVKEIYEQNQIDFVDMKNMKVEQKVKFIIWNFSFAGYVFSFSLACSSWKKKSSHVKKEIQRIFKDQGLPERL